MIYIDQNYSDYKYLVDYSDNYIALTNQHRVFGTYEDSEDFSVYIQYINPSIHGLLTTKTAYNDYTFRDISSQLSSSFFDRADFPQIFVCCFITFIIYCFIINQLTKLVKRGGVFGSY